MTTGLAAGTIVAAYSYVKDDLPSVTVLKDMQLQIPMRIFSADGLLISQYGLKKRVPLELHEVPLQLKQALLATEDSRFYHHPGVDPIGIMRAAVNLIVTGEKGQGGSTLTMQLARKFFLTAEKKYIRKVREIFIAWHIEQLLSKEEIITLYLNKMELGHRAFGVGAAAQVYYGKPIHDLNLAQIATLAGLYKAPSDLNPITNPEKSKNRRRVVLSRMLAEGYISQSMFDNAANAPVTAARHGAKIELDAPYLADMIYREMVDMYGKEAAETRGFNVYATAPSDLQRYAQDAVRSNLHDYDERHGYRGPHQQLWGTPLAIYPKLVAKVEANNDSTEALEDNDNQTKIESDIAVQGQLLAAPQVDLAWQPQAIHDYLKTQPEYKYLKPAVVVQVEQRQIQVQNQQGDIITIGWDGMAWARPFIDDTHQGPAPKIAADIINAGALVWIRKQDQQQWQLSQFPDASSAFVALNPTTGAIQAVVGGYSFQQSQFNRATQAVRQVGSNIKPFIYSAALASGYTLASVVNDAPISQWDRRSGMAWRPKNSPEEYDGPIRLRQALGKSKNVVSVRLLRGVGINDTIDYLTNFGFEKSDLPRDESLSLGSASFTPIQLARGFATIENGGFLISPYVIARVEDSNGNLLWKTDPEVACKECLNQLATKGNIPAIEAETGDEDTADALQAEINVANQTVTEQNTFLVKQMLRTAVTGGGSWSKKTAWNGTGWRAKNILKRSDLAGKTGTTNESKDTWFSGIGGHLVATAWVGFDDNNRSLGRTTGNQYLINKNPKRYNWMGNAMVGAEDGARVAQPVWIRFMQNALEGVVEQKDTLPDNLVTVRIDRTTGKLTNRTDHTSRFEYFEQGSEPFDYVSDTEMTDSYNQQVSQPEIEDTIF